MEEEIVDSAETAGMVGDFADGSVLWYWYDNYLILPALVLALYLTYRALRRYSWTQRTPLILKGLSTLGTALVLLVTLDRFTVETIGINSNVYGYSSMVGALVAVIIGGYAEVRWRLDMRRAGPRRGAPEEAIETLQGGGGMSGETMVLSRVARSAAWLVVRSGGEAGKIYDLQGDRVRFGRSPENEIQIDHPSVDQSHAMVRIQQGNYLLYDMGSAGGTSVNGNPVAGALLRDGSQISIGASEIFFTQVGGGTAEYDTGQRSSHGVLLVRSGPSVGESYTVGDEALLIGRQPGEGGIQIDDPAVSQRHALIRPTPQGCLLYDLGSANGTSVDNEALTGVTLQSGDVLAFGEAELQFVLQERTT